MILQGIALLAFVALVLVGAKAMLDGMETAAQHEADGKIGDDGLLKDEYR